MPEKERGLWVERTAFIELLKRGGKPEDLVSFAKGKDLDALYLQVFRGGRTWLRTASGLQDKEAIARGLDSDFFRSLLESCRTSEIKVHLWVNVFNLSDTEDKEVIERFGRESLLIDNVQKNIVDWLKNPPHPFELDTPALWIDPASPKVKEFWRDFATELTREYPAAGLHLDFFRYPYCLPIKPGSFFGEGFDFGYGGNSISAFEKETGRQAIFVERDGEVLRPRDYEAGLAWDSWRRGQVEAYLKVFREVLPPDRELSVAVVPWSDRAYLSAFQDWRSWLTKNLVNKVLLMSYTGDLTHFSQMVRQAAAFGSAQNKILAGIGLYRLSSFGQAADQEKVAIEQGASGVVFFSYGGWQVHNPPNSSP